MPRKSPPKPDKKPQFERFIEVAKEIGAGVTDEGLTSVIRRIAKTEQPAKPTSKKAK